jgi:7-carboxy-7-deazaguanine synthase
MGVSSVFVRFSGCNLRCSWKNSDGTSTLCDTPFASFHPERNKKSLAEVCDILRENLQSGDDLVITGGEPMLWPAIVRGLREVFRAFPVTIETNGTQPLVCEDVLYSVSPKLSNSGKPSNINGVIENLVQLCRATQSKGHTARQALIQLKFVCSLPEDIKEIEWFLSRLRNEDILKYMRVFLMPQGNTKAQIEERAPWVVAESLRLGVHYSDRLQIRLWGDKRGV